MPPTINRELWEVTGLLEQLDELVSEATGWVPVPADEDPSDLAAREALERKIADLAAEALPRIEELAPQAHGLLMKARAEVQAVDAEAERVRLVGQAKHARYDRLKHLVKRMVQCSGARKLAGPTWRLRLFAHGGKQPLECKQPELLEPSCSQPITVPADLLVNALRHKLAAEQGDDVEGRSASNKVLQHYGLEPLRPSASRAWAYHDQHGELPRGWEALPRGESLAVE